MYENTTHEVTFPKIDLGFYTEQIPYYECIMPGYTQANRLYTTDTEKLSIFSLAVADCGDMGERTLEWLR